MGILAGERLRLMSVKDETHKENVLGMGVENDGPSVMCFYQSTIHHYKMRNEKIQMNRVALLKFKILL